MRCIYCKGTCVKKGIRNSVQKYRCKECSKYFQAAHKKSRRQRYMLRIGMLTCRGCGIRDISVLLQLPKTTVQRWLLRLAAKCTYKPHFEPGSVFEVDELRTFCGHKRQEHWVLYGMERSSGRIVCMLNGPRNRLNLQQVIDTILLWQPQCIYTDGLPVYRSIVPVTKHRVFRRCTNHIERHNLTLRQHIRRLSRHTLGYTRSAEMLTAVLQIYCFVKGT
ncbi:MAG: IS1 family transposase [Bacteroidia bacterium]|nr:IS1 family transposase [Bacteroidia bacterium]